MSPQVFSEDEVNRRARVLAGQIVNDERIARIARDEDEGSFRLERKLPLLAIIAFVGQTVAFVWVGASWKQAVDLRLVQLEKAEAERKPQEARLIRLEERVISVSDTLDRIEKSLNVDVP